MKKFYLLFCLIAGLMITGIPPASAQSVQEELRMLRQRIEELERKVETGEIEREEVKKISSQLKEKVEEGILGKWSDKIELSGCVEVEASFSDKDRKAGSDSEDSDIVLATVELGVDLDIHKYVKGHILFLWEEDDTEPVDVDEATITLGGTEDIPFFLTAGKMYPPIGNFVSFFITDPLTLELAETRESAVMVGYANDIFELQMGAFNGDLTDEEDDRINSFVVSGRITPPSDKLGGLGLTLGGYYTSNLDSDNLEGCFADPLGNNELDDLVGAAGCFVSASLSILALEFEYITALDEFEAGEMTFDGGQKSEPSAWNLELAIAPMERLEFAFRYSETDEMRGGLDDDTLPEKMWGLVASYELFENVGFGVEFLHSEWENDDEEDLFTTQLAIEF